MDFLRFIENLDATEIKIKVMKALTRPKWHTTYSQEREDLWLSSPYHKQYKNTVNEVAYSVPFPTAVICDLSFNHGDTDAVIEEKLEKLISYLTGDKSVRFTLRFYRVKNLIQQHQGEPLCVSPDTYCPAVIMLHGVTVKIVTDFMPGKERHKISTRFRRIAESLGLRKTLCKKEHENEKNQDFGAGRYHHDQRIGYRVGENDEVRVAESASGLVST